LKDAKEKSKQKQKYSKKVILDRILIACSPATTPEKEAC
jgi:hypothetical protein